MCGAETSPVENRSRSGSCVKELPSSPASANSKPAYRVPAPLCTHYQTVSRAYQRLREAVYHVAELEAGKLKGEIEIDDAYFGGRRKGKRGRGSSSNRRKNESVAGDEYVKNLQ